MNNKQINEVLTTFSSWLEKLSVASFVFSIFQKADSYGGILLGIITLLVSISLKIWMVKDDNNS